MHSAGWNTTPKARIGPEVRVFFNTIRASRLGVEPGRMALAEEIAGTQRVSLKLSAQAERYARRDAPVEAREMAARGALPLEPVELTTVLFVLAHDPEPTVKETARRSLEELPDGVLTTVLSGKTHPALLSYLAHLHAENEAYCESVALNAAADDSTIAWLATLPHSRVVDIVSQNQERMLRSEEIVDALGTNPLTGRAVIERILGFLGIEQREADGEEAPLDGAEAEAAVLALLGEDMEDIAKILAQETQDDLQDSKLEGNLYAAVQKMSVLQKVKLARAGGKEARALLVKDRNRIVAASVLGSPKLTETELIVFAQNRSIAEELLRVIAANRDWTKSYRIKLALVTNPKTPQPQAVHFIHHLQDRDLRALMKSKDVSTQVSAQARRILTKKGKL
jgi:hypothetical protein